MHLSEECPHIQYVCAWAVNVCMECSEGKAICLVNGIIRDISHWQHWTNWTMSLCPTDITRTGYGFLVQNSWEKILLKCLGIYTYPVLSFTVIFTANLFLVHRNWREWRRCRPTCSWQLSFALMRGGNSVLFYTLFKWNSNRNRLFTLHLHTKCFSQTRDNSFFPSYIYSLSEMSQMTNCIVLFACEMNLLLHMIGSVLTLITRYFSCIRIVVGNMTGSFA